MRALMTAVSFLGLAVTPALAQSSPAPANNAPAATPSATQAPGAMQASVKHDLEQAGFTDVQVMPSSFLVRAKDKSGRPVMMVINPDSVTEITTVPGTTPTAKN